MLVQCASVSTDRLGGSAKRAKFWVADSCFDTSRPLSACLYTGVCVEQRSFKASHRGLLEIMLYFSREYPREIRLVPIDPFTFPV